MLVSTQGQVASRLESEEKGLRARYLRLERHYASDPVGLLLLDSTMERLAEVERARLRLEMGMYGICESCGSPIDEARLQAKVEARLCIKCAQAQDAGRTPLRRSIKATWTAERTDKYN